MSGPGNSGAGCGRQVKGFGTASATRPMARGLLAGTLAALAAGSVALAAPAGSAAGGVAPGHAVRVPCDPDRLISAVTFANAHGGGILQLADGCVYTLTAHQGDDGLPVIQQPVTILGQDATIVRAGAAAPFRVFDVTNNGALTLRRLTVTGGLVNGDENGGGLRVRPGGTATLIHSTFTFNATENLGGAIYNGGTLVVDDSVVSGNIGRFGGGIVNLGELTVRESTLIRNHASQAGGALADSGMLTMLHSTVNHNSGPGAGGLYIERTADIEDSSVTGNSGGIGGISLFGGQLTLLRSRVSDNIGIGIITLLGPFGASSLLLDSGEVSGNASGGIIVAEGSAALRHSRITANNAADAAVPDGGGVVVQNGSAALIGTKVTGNNAIDRPGGVSNDNGTATVDNRSVITGNRPTNCAGSTIAVPNCFG